MNILIADQIEDICTVVLERNGFTVTNRPGLKEADLVQLIPAFDGLIVRSGIKVTKAAIVAGKNLKIIGRAGAGVDNIDVEAATRRGIIVMNTPGGNTISAAEHTMSLLLALVRNIPQAHESMRQGKWERKKYVGTELQGKTIGILGLGKIGREVASRCQSFGMDVLGYDPVLSSDVAAKMHIGLASIPEVLQRADLISVHTPLTDETRHLLSDKEFAMCKKGARIVNCARGGIVDEAALFRALEAGIIGGAALDVFEQEPPTNALLLQHPRVIVTPHLGASTGDAQERVAQQIANQIAEYVAGRAIVGAVNAEAVQLSLRKELQPFVLLAEKLGRFHASIMSGQLRKLTVEVCGPLLKDGNEIITAATLKGLLSHVLSEPVNLVNAKLIAAELGLHIEERRESEDPNYVHAISVTFETDQATRRISGTVFADQHLRLTAIDEFPVEINPDGFILLYKNVDRPGILAKVATTLAASGINIASVALGRNKPGDTALAIIGLDSAIPETAQSELEKLEGILEIRSAQL